MPAMIPLANSTRLAPGLSPAQEYLFHHLRTLWYFSRFNSASHRFYTLLIVLCDNSTPNLTSSRFLTLRHSLNNIMNLVQCYFGSDPLHSLRSRLSCFNNSLDTIVDLFQWFLAVISLLCSEISPGLLQDSLRTQLYAPKILLFYF
jgi:hypothetical protein